uniref:Uncharacterized protein n=2 Tax=Haptolina brevifila TaxID=156173 RepID=A0A7S2G3G4_9EUKA|mmetsp:Transcript_24995/g.50226  ORF Transcript_24995/g.50226 Transcript_24995/m.50226 type:complete len:164 (+) Transcript_24995:49-540(+)
MIPHGPRVITADLERGWICVWDVEGCTVESGPCTCGPWSPPGMGRGLGRGDEDGNDGCATRLSDAHLISSGSALRQAMAVGRCTSGLISAFLSRDENLPQLGIPSVDAIAMLPPPPTVEPHCHRDGMHGHMHEHKHEHAASPAGRLYAVHEGVGGDAYVTCWW